ncbi:SRPBCC family protein [Winogradskyella helgolandensis]|uniref:SRPBCC family protein n=1 Tax=Winogradskyella helgolandensis TaxID=2697010 RepID=UPI0015B837CE|nr:SRPBCC family protein [Winogradskyella helgolandensis]
MKAFKSFLLLLLILVIGVSIYIAVQPNSYEVTRTRTIKAPASVIYNTVVDFKTWNSWSSWIETNPEIVVTLGDTTKGVGGSYTWNENGDEGYMSTTGVNPNTSITQEMQFATYPKSDVNWDFKANEDGTTDVTWTISGDNLPFGFKMWSAFSGGMENQVGPDYERSLEKLDSVVLADMKVYTIKVEGTTQHSGGYYLYNTASCKFSDFEKNMTAMLPKVGAYAITHNVTMAGPPFILYHKWDEENDTVMFSTCVPTNSRIITDEAEILTGKLESFTAVRTVLKGNYSNLKEAWDTTMNYIADNNLEMIEGGPMLETYLTDPMSEQNPANWITEIYVAVK